jgi:hypothetical protein
MAHHALTRPLFSEQSDALVAKANAERWTALFSRSRNLAPAVDNMVDTIAVEVVAVSETLLPGSTVALGLQAKSASRPQSKTK